MALEKNKRDAWSLRQVLKSSTAAFAILLGGMNASLADESIDGALNGLAPVSSEELQSNRGGFDLGKLKLTVGFNIATSIGGLTITNTFSLSPQGITHTGTNIATNETTPNKP